jgi:hypothetical protein
MKENGWQSQLENAIIDFMVVRFHPHARQRMAERGATDTEVSAAIQEGERFEAKFARTGFRRNFVFEREWGHDFYRTKQVEA